MPSPTATVDIVESVLLRNSKPSARDYTFMDDYFDKLPLVAADADPSTVNQTTQRLKDGGSRNLILSGTNAVSANVTADTNGDGGATILNTGGGSDQGIVSPLTINGGAASGFNRVRWKPGKQATLRARFTTGASALATIIHVGFKLTANLDETTDNDQVMFVFNTAVDAVNWYGATSIGGVDARVAFAPISGQPPLSPWIKYAITTNYDVRIQISAAGIPSFYLEDKLVGSGTKALTSAAAFIPVIGIQGASKSLTARYLSCSRQW